MTTTVLLRSLFDDAAMFPPGNASVPEAVTSHLERRSLPEAWLTGPLVIRADHLNDLDNHITEDIDVIVTIPTGLGDLIPTLHHAARSAHVRVTAVEVAIGRPLTTNDVRLVTEAQEFATHVPIALELPSTAWDLKNFARCAELQVATKFRTGGLTPEAFPDETTLGAAIIAAVGNGVPFKTTAGLHHALRNTDEVHHFEQHGFLNLLLSTHLALSGAPTCDVIDALRHRDFLEVVPPLRALTISQAQALRTSFRSLGTCSIDDPVTDLRELGLDTTPDTAPAAAT